MGELVVTEFATLDGVAQAPGEPDEDRAGGFTHGGWQAPWVDEESGNVMFAAASGMDALLLGRRTYDIFAAYWPNAPEDIPFTGLLNRVPKYVASQTLTDPLSWHGSSVLAEDLAAAVASIKERHREVHVIGSLDLVQSLLHLGLVDRLVLWLYPVLLGTGKKVFADGTAPAALTLTDSTVSATGAINLVYELGGVVPPMTCWCSSAVSSWIVRVRAVFSTSRVFTSLKSRSAFSCWKAAWRFWPIITNVDKKMASSDTISVSVGQGLLSNTSIQTANRIAWR